MSRAVIYLVLQDTRATGTNWGLGGGRDHTGGSQGPGWRGREGSGNIRREPLGAWHLFILPLEASFVPSRHVGKEQRQMALGEQQPGAGRTEEDEQGHLLRAMHAEPRA